MNFYGQLSNEYLQTWKQRYDRVIVDNAQSYFQLPVDGLDTLYTCRKYFGVADGAFLYSDMRLGKEIPQDESFERMHFLLGRYERSAADILPIPIDQRYGKEDMRCLVDTIKRVSYEKS